MADGANFRIPINLTSVVQYVASIVMMKNLPLSVNQCWAHTKKF